MSSYYDSVTKNPGRTATRKPDDLWDQFDARKEVPERYRNTMEALYGGGDYDQGGQGGWRDPTTGQVVPTHMGGFVMPGPNIEGTGNSMEEAQANYERLNRGFDAVQSMNAPGLGQTQYGTDFTKTRGVGSLRYADLLRR